MFGVKARTPLLKQSGHPMSGTAAKVLVLLNSSSGALRATISASTYTSFLNWVCRHKAILVNVEARSGRFIKYKLAGDLLTMRSTGIIWS